MRDPSGCPPVPEGLTGDVLVYERFAESYGWPPRVVDQMTRDELFWLPVIRDAKAEAAETLRPKGDD
jgi:hypothetical protein